jgi:hypothetical protein
MAEKAEKRGIAVIDIFGDDTENIGFGIIVSDDSEEEKEPSVQQQKTRILVPELQIVTNIEKT